MFPSGYFAGVYFAAVYWATASGAAPYVPPPAPSVVPAPAMDAGASAIADPISPLPLIEPFANQDGMVGVTWTRYLNRAQETLLSTEELVVLQAFQGDTPADQSAMAVQEALASIGPPTAFDDSDLRSTLAVLAVPERRWADQAFITDTHANRITASAYSAGSFYYETDRNALYICQLSGSTQTWQWCAGTMRGTLSPDLKPGDLGAADAGFRFYATDYFHLYRWTGAAWEFGEADGGSQFIVVGATGTAPTGGLWQVCDGTAVNCAQANGTLASVTTPNLAGDVFIRGAAAQSAQVAAAVPTWQAGATTDNGTTGISVSAHSTASDTTVTGAGTRVTTATHTVVDSGHTHNLSNANAKLNAPSDANGGVPLRISLVWYMRR